jgi:hypothetical protein
VFLIMFNAVQALPLRQRRTWCPRMSRGGCAGLPRCINQLWTRHRPFHEVDPVKNGARTGIFSLRKQSVTAFSPRQQSCPRTNLVHAQATASIVHNRPAAADAHCPQAGRIREQSTSPIRSRTRSGRERGTQEFYPHRLVDLSILSPINFPVHIRIISAHALV